MELQEAIASRRSIKKFKHDMTIDDDKLYQAIEKLQMLKPWHARTMENYPYSQR